ncbi:MAG TPA: hypothetical protein VIM10_10405 [Actinopolymorphaceae bacterium]|jgi:hypothetical protein
MTRVIRFLDRAATLVAGLVLVGIGAAAFVWDRGLGPNWPAHPDAERVLTFLRSGWVPWAAGFGGVIIVVVGLGWLIAHASRRRVGPLQLETTDSAGAAGVPTSDAAAVAPVVDVGAVASAAAAELARRPDVINCRGKAIRDRGQIVVELAPTLSAQADLAAVTAAAEHAAASVHTALGRDDVYVRVAARVKR